MIFLRDRMPFAGALVVFLTLALLSSALAHETIGSAVPGVAQNAKIAAMEAYRLNFEKRIKQFWSPPQHEEARRLKLFCVLSPDGNLLWARILVSSRLDEVDKAALKAVKNAAPFGPVPENVKGNLDVELTLGSKYLGRNCCAAFRQY